MYLYQEEARETENQEREEMTTPARTRKSRKATPKRYNLFTRKRGDKNAKVQFEQLISADDREAARAEARKIVNALNKKFDKAKRVIVRVEFRK